MPSLPPSPALRQLATRAAVRSRRLFLWWAAVQLVGLLVLGGTSALFASRVRHAIAAGEAERISDSSGALARTLRVGRGLSDLPPFGLIGYSPLFSKTVAVAETGADRGAAAAELLSGLFGESGHVWLLGLQNPAEMRATGGLIGSWAVVQTGADMPELLGVNRIRALIKPAGPPVAVSSSSVEADEPMMRHFGSRTRVQNVNIVPDMPTVGREFLAAYNNSRTNNPDLGPKADGVILLDTSALELFLEITGPLTVPGIDEPVTADNVQRITLRDLYVAYETEAERGRVLEALVRQLWSTLMSAEVSPSTKLLQRSTAVLEDGHVQMWSRDRTMQSLIERLGADGAWPQPDGLAVGLVGQNIAGNKTDQFLDRRVSLDVSDSKMPDGSKATKTRLTIRLDNHAPAEGLPTYILGPHERLTTVLGPGDNRQMYTVYTSDPWTDLKIDGEPVSGPSLRDGEWWVTRLVVTVPQGSSAKIEVTTIGPATGSDQVIINLGVNVRATRLSCTADGTTTEPIKSVERSATCPLR